jgi:hypothetical protein
VRKCPAVKCQNLFWMKRKDQKACISLQQSPKAEQIL